MGTRSYCHTHFFHEPGLDLDLVSENTMSDLDKRHHWKQLDIQST